MKLGFLFALALCLFGLAACGQTTINLPQSQATAGMLIPTLQAGAQTVRQTAVALATQNPVDLEAVKQTAVALATQNPVDLEAVKQTAVALATQNPIDLQGAKETAQALVPTLQSQAPELRATAEALATLIPERGAPALATLQAMTAGADVPEDVPIIQPSSMMISTKAHIIYTTTQLPVEVVQFYQTEMAKQGWKLQPTSATTDSGGRLGFEKDTRIVKITIVRTGEATTVDLSLEE